jgi:hypothetical protein
VNAPAPYPRVTIYCDESSLRDRHCGWGGVWLPAASEGALRAAFVDARRAAGWPDARSELKWTKAGGVKATPVYRGVIDAFVRSSAAFHCLVIDRYDAGSRRSGDDELDHYKNLYWLISKRVRPPTRYSVVLDKRTDLLKDRLLTLREILNATAARDHTYTVPACFEEVRPADSKNEQMLQLADVLLGAVCFHMNKRHREANSSPAKCALAEHLAYSVGFVGGVLTPTTASEGKFNVWRWSERH